MKRTSLLASLALMSLAAGVLLGCGGSGRVTLLLTDAPGDFKKAVVTIEEIYLQGDGRVVLRDTAVTTDLITLANDTAELVTDAEVPAGSYSQLRFVISGGYIEVENDDGSTSIYASSPDYAGLPAGAQVAGSLQMPSYGSSGLKIDIGTVAIGGNQKVILVDFDVAQSFGHDTGTDKWVMHPVIKGAELTMSSSVVVTLTQGPGVTLPPGVTLAAFDASLTNVAGSTERVTLSDANGDGTFEAEFRWLIPGPFVIDFVTATFAAPQTNPARPYAVTLGSGEAPTYAFTLTGL